ncbi:MAG TPA: glycosyltransferase family 2 protein [Candidatus Acidoferrales bacterium]|nr:glycosyltransferase family 2 protein [Candidatus Acidoferrales bacterium]
MTLAEWLFWISFGCIAYTYALYPAALAAACAFQRLWRRPGGRPSTSRFASAWPTISLVIPAFNEEKHLAAKLRNLAELDYPSDSLEIIFVSDGSTDATDLLISRAELPGLRYLRIASRQGKPTALNAGVAAAGNEILVFSDAATLFACDAIEKLARHFADPRVGVVCGTVEFAPTPDGPHTEGLYWQYERWMREREARIGAATTASGAIYAVRRAAYRPLPADAILDDLLVPMTARKLGYRIEQEPEARALEPAAATLHGEFARRARLAAGGFRSLRQLGACATASPSVFWAFFSHKLLRWLSPVFLLALLGTSLALRGQPIYRFALAGQLAFYLWALAGMTFRERLGGVRFALVGYFVMAMNAALLVGLARALAGRQPVTWIRVN